LEFVDFFTTDLVTGFNKRKTTTPKEKTRKKKTNEKMKEM
jgi:hypothetical protein